MVGAELRFKTIYGVAQRSGHDAGIGNHHIKLIALGQQLAAQGKGPFEWKTIPQGAATSVWAGVVAPAEEIGGRYCANCKVGKVISAEAPVTVDSEDVRAYALDPANAEALWKKSEEMVGEKF